jgi:hypothetical protein
MTDEEYREVEIAACPFCPLAWRAAVKPPACPSCGRDFIIYQSTWKRGKLLWLQKEKEPPVSVEPEKTPVKKRTKVQIEFDGDE